MQNRWFVCLFKGEIIIGQLRESERHWAETVFERAQILHLYWEKEINTIKRGDLISSNIKDMIGE